MTNHQQRAMELVQKYFGSIPHIEAEFAQALADAERGAFIKCRGVVERELSYRQFLEETDPMHWGNHPITACKEILGAIDAGIRSLPQHQHESVAEPK